MEYFRLHASIATRLSRKCRPPVNPLWVPCVIVFKVYEIAEHFGDAIIWLSVVVMHNGRVDKESLRTAIRHGRLHLSPKIPG